MNTEVYDSETVDVLARWWWPGQWLRIVWSVWVDQKWYWRHVYPRLENRRRGWGILAQTTLGGILIALCLYVIHFIIVGGLDMAAVQDEFTLNQLSLLGLSALLFFGIGLLIGVVEGVPGNAVGIIVSAVYLLYGSFNIEIGSSWLIYFAFCLMLGLVFGIVRTVSKGYMSRNDVFVEAFFIFLITPNISVPDIVNPFLSVWSKRILGYILVVAGIYAGARWATRDLTEEMAGRLKKA